MSPTVSFDVFDTLLTRIWAEPHDLFVRLGERLAALGLSSLAPLEFAARRIAAESRAREAAPRHEVQLPAIVELLGRQLAWNEGARALALETELALEAEGIRAVPGAVALVAAARESGSRIAFLSDMYLPPSFLRTRLNEAGCFQPGDLLLVSGAIGAGKGTGELFREARRQISGDFSTWTHFGDNPDTDRAAPRRLGIAARLVPRARLNRRERVLRGADRIAPVWQSLVAGAARRARLACPAGTDSDRRRILWEAGATVAGPLFWGYTDWCLREAARRNLSDLYFLARGGQIFLRIAAAIQAHRPGGPRCHYLHTSRLAFASAAETGDPERLRQRAAPADSFHSVRQALANLGVEARAEFAPPQFRRDDWDRNLSPVERRQLAGWLLHPARLPGVQAALEERSRRARAYLEQCGLADGRRLGLVDTGWGGTIQSHIEGLLGAAGKPAAIDSFYLGLRPVREFRCSGELIGYTNRFDHLPLRRETTHLILLEIFARGDHGPLLGFESVPGRIEPRLGPANEAEREEVRWFQEAILAFTRALLETGAGLDAPEDAVARTVIGGYREFFRHPTVAEVQVLGRTPHSDQMLEQNHTVLCPEMSLTDVLAAMGSFHHRPPGWWLAGQARLGHAPLLHAYLGLKRIKWWLQTALTGKPD